MRAALVLCAVLAAVVSVQSLSLRHLKSQASRAASELSTPLPPCSNNYGATGSFNGQSPLVTSKVATTYSIVASVPYDKEPAQNPYRVARDRYSSMPPTDPRLVAVGGNKLHKVCAARFLALAAAAKAAGIGELRIASGWREHPYRNDRAYYCAEMKKAYPKKTCEQAGAIKAFKSPHETGLAFDLGSPPPFAPKMATNAQQKASAPFKWMVANAHKYGITPYKYEAWHWECVIPRESFVKGCEFTRNFDVRVTERRTDGKSGW